MTFDLKALQAQLVKEEQASQNIGVDGANDQSASLNRRYEKMDIALNAKVNVIPLSYLRKETLFADYPDMEANLAGDNGEEAQEEAREFVARNLVRFVHSITVNLHSEPVQAYNKANETNPDHQYISWFNRFIVADPSKKVVLNNAPMASVDPIYWAIQNLKEIKNAGDFGITQMQHSSTGFFLVWDLDNHEIRYIEASLGQFAEATDDFYRRPCSISKVKKDASGKGNALKLVFSELKGGDAYADDYPENVLGIARADVNDDLDEMVGYRFGTPAIDVVDLVANGAESELYQKTVLARRRLFDLIGLEASYPQNTAWTDIQLAETNDDEADNDLV